MRSDYNIAPPPSAERLAEGVVQSVSVVLAAVGCVALGVLAGIHTDRNAVGLSITLSSVRYCQTAREPRL
jgi:hypothetical protein